MKKPRLEDMTLRERIGQTGLVRTNHVYGKKGFLKDNPFGGLWARHAHIFETAVNNAENSHGKGLDYRYTKECDAWIQELNNELSIPLLSAIDAEAGAVDAIPGTSAMPTAAALGAARSEELAYQLGYNVASESLVSGANWIWGPVADNACMFAGVSLNRTPSADMELSARLLKAEVKGMQAAGVAATAKHFPGVDKREYRDPHITLANIDYTMEEWEEHQAPVFQELIDAGVYSVMVGHMAFPAADDTVINGAKLPSTLSYKIVTELLKEKMGFTGVVITDACGMRGLDSIYQGKQLYVELLKAGNDMLLGPMDPHYIDLVEEAVLAGELSEERINDACQRVLDMKEKLGLFDDGYAVGGGVTPEMLERSSRTNREIARKGISLLCDVPGLLPLDPKKIRKVKIIYIGYSDNAYDALEHMVDAFAAHGAQADYQRGLDWHIKEFAENYDLIVYASYIGSHSPYGYPYFVQDMIGPFNHVLTYGVEKSLGVSLGSPFLYHDFFAAMPTFINTYGFCKELCEEFVNGLYGEFPLNTELPYPIRPVMGW